MPSFEVARRIIGDGGINVSGFGPACIIQVRSSNAQETE